MSVPADRVAVDEFGLPTVKPEDNPLLNWDRDEPVADQTEEIVPETAAPKSKAQEALDAVMGADAEREAEGQAAASTEPETPAEEGEAQTLILGKYKDQDALVKGYQNAMDLQRRTAERAAANEMRLTEAIERSRQLEVIVQRVLPALQQQVVQQQPVVVPQQDWGQPGQPEETQTVQQQRLNPQALAALIDTIVETRLGQETQRLRDDMQDQATEEAAKSTVLSFLQSKGVELRGPEDGAMTETAVRLNEAWAARDELPVNLGDPEALEIVWEASRDEELRQVLEQNPSYFDSDTGMQMARVHAALLRGQPVTQPQTQTIPASQVGQTVGQRKPVTESASTGASPANTRPNDEVAEAMRAYLGAKKDDVFF